MSRPDTAQNRRYLIHPPRRRKAAAPSEAASWQVGSPVEQHLRGRVPNRIRPSESSAL